MNHRILPTSRDVVEKDNCYALGDIFDLKNAEANELAGLLIEYNEYRELFKDRLVSGNHEGNDLPINIHLDNKILLTHYDWALWDAAKVNKFRNEKRGQGCGIPQWIASKTHGKVGKTDKKNAAAYAKKYNSTCIIGGHTHTKKLIDEVVDGVRVIFLPVGKTILDL